MNSNRKSQAGFSLVELLVLVWYVLILGGGGVGWCMNIYKLASDSRPITDKSQIIRIIGIPVAPMGAIVGYMKL